MTDRVQPGAIDSVVRNDELAQIFGQFSDGWVVPGSDPTPAAQRRADIDATALDGFALSTSASSLDVAVAPGEAFVGGWCVRDVSTTLPLPADSTSEIVVGWNPDAVYDPNADADRDAADETIIDLAANVDANYPTAVVHEVTTDGSGVTSASRVVSVGPAIDAGTVSASDQIGNPTYPTLSDVPTNLPEGTQVYVEAENALYVEDGT
jgi:hypothetical protein